jgi:hypothetical protein
MTVARFPYFSKATTSPGTGGMAFEDFVGFEIGQAATNR